MNTSFSCKPFLLGMFNMLLLSFCYAENVKIGQTQGDPTIAEEHTICAIPTCNPTNMSNTSDLYKYCEERELVLQGRCCMNHLNATGNDASIVGVDLSGCNITSLDELDEYSKNDSTIAETKFLLLSDIPLNCSKDPIENHFKGFKRLEHLVISNINDCTCPGGMTAWNNIIETTETLTCVGQVNVCTSDDVQCPTNSQCEPDGPGSPTLCPCENDFYGYKCLRNGAFPGTWFAIGTSATTIVVSGVMWVSTRRHVGTQNAVQ